MFSRFGVLFIYGTSLPRKKDLVIQVQGGGGYLQLFCKRKYFKIKSNRQFAIFVPWSFSL